MLPLPLLLLSSLTCIYAAGLSPQNIALVKARLAEHSTDSWVSGTRAEALIELDYKNTSVFSRRAFPVLPSPIPQSSNDIIKGWYDVRPAGSNQMVQVNRGAAGDPASLGVAWILARLTDTVNGGKYEEVVQRELEFLMYRLKRTTDGAMSHRPNEEDVQLWADFVYMVPPFLAYYGVIYNRVEVIKESYNQIRLYRQYLRDPSTNLWRHVVLGQWQDNGLWGTGNAWAAAGMMRVLATMQNSQYRSQFTSQISDLAQWTNEILTASFSYISVNNLLPNYYNVASFSDSSSSALLAATAYRISSIGMASSTNNVVVAERIRKTIYANLNKQTGWLSPVVDPLNWGTEVAQSPEGQAFVLLMEAAWKNPR